VAKITKPRHPGRTEEQRRVLDEIGCGNFRPTARPSTIKALLKAGLIQQCGEKVLGKDRFGVIAIPEYQMPTPVHMAWCKYQTSQFTDSDLDERLS